MKDIEIGIIGGTSGMGKWFAGFLQKEIEMSMGSIRCAC